jgi:hypothetical protein
MDLLYFDSAADVPDLGLVFLQPIWRTVDPDESRARARAEAERIYDQLRATLPLPTMSRLYELFTAMPAPAPPSQCPSCGVIMLPWASITPEDA